MQRAATCLLLAFSGLAACSAPERDVSIVFDVEHGGVPLACDTGGQPPVPGLTDLRFYVHNVHLVKGEGERVPVSPVPDGAWQSGRVAMVDLESGAGPCANGTPEQNAVLRGRVAKGDFTGLEFTLGVPFDLNHADPLAAPAPLDDPAMHWHWRSGYKFLRAGIATPEDGFWLHLGSTGCIGTTGDIRECTTPNRVTVTLSPFDTTTDRVVLDLGRLFKGVDLGDGEAGDCSSGPAERACRPVLESLGLAGARAGTDVFLGKPQARSVARR